MNPNERPATSASASRAEYQGSRFSTKSAYGRLSAYVPWQNTTTVTSAGISVIGSLRRAAAMASPSRVWAFSRPSKSSQAASQLSRSTIDGAAWAVNGWNGNRVTVRSYRENGGSSRVDRVPGTYSSARLDSLVLQRVRG